MGTGPSRAAPPGRSRPGPCGAPGGAGRLPPPPAPPSRPAAARAAREPGAPEGRAGRGSRRGQEPPRGAIPARGHPVSASGGSRLSPEVSAAGPESPHLLRVPLSPPPRSTGKLRGNRQPAGLRTGTAGTGAAGGAAGVTPSAVWRGESPPRAGGDRGATYPPQAPAEGEEEDRQVPHASQVPGPAGSATPRRSAGAFRRRRAGAGSRRGTIGPGGRRRRRAAGAPARTPRPAGGRRPAAVGGSGTCPRPPAAPAAVSSRPD